MNSMLSAAATARAALGDADLLALARRGDEAAVRLLVKRFNRPLFRVARGIVRDDGEAEDVVQETYVRAFTSAAMFRGEASLATWLTRIAVNEALGRLRRRRPTADLALLDDPEGSTLMETTAPSLQAETPEAGAGRSQIRAVLESAVDALPDGFRLVFILREVEGLSTEETAERLALLPETVRTRLHRARRLVRRFVETAVSPGFSEIFPFDGARCVNMADRVIARLAQREG